MPDFDAIEEDLFDPTMILDRRAQAVTLLRDSTTLAAQQLVIARPSNRSNLTLRNATGRSEGADYVLIGDDESDVVTGDRFKFASQTFRVIFVDYSVPNRCEAYAIGIASNA